MKAFHFKVTVEVERESGKFMSRDEVQEQLQDALDSANPDTVDGGPDGDTVMNVIMWEVDAE